MRQAVGTSLFYYFINSGFTGDLMSGVHLDIELLLTISIMALLGLFIRTVIKEN
jgi:hypothetical protein